MAYGTLSTLDTLLAVRQSVVQFGEDRAWTSIQAALDAHNAQINEMLGSLIEKTTDIRRGYGTGDIKVMDEMDQWGQADAQKITVSVAIDFPLRRYGQSLQWTRQWMMSNTVGQLAAEVNGIMDADRINMLRQTKRAVYIPTNSTFVDKLGTTVANVPLNIKAFANNDGSAYPVGPNGEIFATSHTHYLASATLTGAAADSLVLAVQEHFNSGQPVIVINSADEAAWRALPNFRPYIDPRLTLNYNANQPLERLNFANIYNREIGLYGAALLRIRPWALPNYAFGYIEGQAPPLVMRVPTYEGLGDLNLDFEDERLPLRARSYGRQFGIGVWQRVGGAVLEFNNATYQTPVI
jgi:hypothetical protein